MTRNFIDEVRFILSVYCCCFFPLFPVYLKYFHISDFRLFLQLSTIYCFICVFYAFIYSFVISDQLAGLFDQELHRVEGGCTFAEGRFILSVYCCCFSPSFLFYLKYFHISGFRLFLRLSTIYCFICVFYDFIYILLLLLLLFCCFVVLLLFIDNVGLNVFRCRADILGTIIIIKLAHLHIAIIVITVVVVKLFILFPSSSLPSLAPSNCFLLIL